MREKLSSRLAFILLSAGCAIGIGNVWRFPYVMGQSGGGWFVLLYLFFLAILGLPVLVMEFATGRAARRSIAGIHQALTPERSVWWIHGLAGFLGCTCLLMFYTTVAGWMLIYFCRTSIGAFDGLNTVQIAEAFTQVLSSPMLQIIAVTVVCLSATVVCAIGLQKGLERVSKWMMLALLLLIVVLAFNSLMLDGAMPGIKFLFVPSLERIKQVGFSTVIANAMNQAFFTLSLGIGSMAIFGSYIDRNRSLLGEAVNVATLDTFVAICAGVIIIPACFAYGVEPNQGPGLIFVTLPNVFCHMPLGRLWGALFFLFMCFAALTTVFAVFENIVACFADYTGFNRKISCVIMGLILLIGSIPCILGFNLWSAFHPLGGTTNILDLEDFIVSDLLLPLGALSFAVYCCYNFGWGWRRFIAEANAGKGLVFPTWLRGYCAYILPLVILVVFVVNILRRFS